jgi:hypothetical protein
MSRRNEEVNETEFEEEEVEATDEVEESAGHRLRASELMFSNTGRIAMGVFGVLLFLGGVAMVSSFLFKDDAKLAGNRKPAADKSKATQAKSTKDVEPTEPAPTTVEPNTVVPTGAFTETAEDGPLKYQPPAADDRYKDYERTNPFPDYTAEVPAEEPATEPEYEAPPYVAAPAVTPIAATEPREFPQHDTAPPVATRNYQVRAGESLFDIARYELGSAARWIEIYDLNATTLNDQLESLAGGTRLKIPER